VVERQTQKLREELNAKLKVTWRDIWVARKNIEVTRGDILETIRRDLEARRWVF
jgi:hypothetical protein